MNVAKVIFAALVIFAAGFVTGAVAFKQDPPPAPQSHHRGPRNWNARFLEKLQRELNLTVQQRDRIEQILRESQERNSQQFQKEIRSLRDSIRAELTPDQLAKYEEILKRSKQGKSGDGKGRGDEKRSDGEPRKNDFPDQSKPSRDSEPAEEKR